MAFDLVHYFSEQSMLQKPELLSTYPLNLRQEYIFDLNALILGKLIKLWRKDNNRL